MAVVLTVHVVETFWTARREGGMVAPFLVVDHNGQQQQTDVAQATRGTTVWNQRATFSYAPTSDLVIMAFDAGRHGGLFLGQAAVDVAAMLQEGRLHTNVPVVSSSGVTVAHVVFDVELSTSSKAMAASLDIPGLTLTTAASKQSSKSLLPASKQSSAIFPDDHLSTCSSPFADVQTGHVRQQLQQPSTLMPRPSTPNSYMTADTVDGSPNKLGQKLGHILGLSMHKRCSSEGNASSPANPATPASVLRGSWSSLDNSAELTAGTGPLLARHSMLRSSQSSFSGPSAPLATPSITAAHAATLQGSIGLAASAAGAAAGVAAATVEAVAGGLTAASARPSATGSAPGSPAHAEQQHRLSHASEASSRSSRFSDATADTRRTTRQTDDIGPAAAVSRDVTSSPRPSQAHRISQVPRLSLSIATPKAAEAPLSPLRANRLKLRLTPSKAPPSPQEKRAQQQRQLERDLQRLQQLALQENAMHITLRNGLASASGESDVAGSSSEDDDQLLREFEAADPAGKEAILYRQLMMQQAERKAGSAHLLRLLATQQHQEAIHDTQLLATLASMSPSSSPRYFANTRLMPESPTNRHYPQVPVPVSPTGKVLNSQPFGAARPASRRSNGTAAPNSSGGGSGSTVSSNSDSSSSRHYPDIPASASNEPQQKQPSGSRKQWMRPGGAAAVIDGRQEPRDSSDAWQSCESGSEAATPMAKASDSGKSSNGADAGKVSSKSKRSPGKHSRLQHTVERTNSGKDIRSYPVDIAALDSARDLDSEGSMPRPGSPHKHSSVQPAYRCVGSATGEPGYAYVHTRPDIGRGARWCEHSMLDAVPYPLPDPLFPVRAVAVEPSAPLQ